MVWLDGMTDFKEENVFFPDDLHITADGNLFLICFDEFL